MEMINDYNPLELLDSIKNRDVKKVRFIFENYNLVDIADTLNSLDSIEEHFFIFKTVPSEYTAEVFAYLDNDVQENIVNKLNSDQLKTVIENLYSDDIVDFINEMPANLVSKIIKSASKETRAEINQLLSYKEDSAGSIMTTEYIMLKESYDYKDAVKIIKKEGKNAETISYLYVVDEKRILKGTLTLKDLIYLEDDETVKDIMETDFVSVNTSTDQEEVARIFSKYDLNAIPVTTNDNRLVGIITADDIIDVIEEETTEDIHKMASVNPLEDEYNKTSAFTLAKNGIGWLIILMLLSTFTTIIMNGFETTIAVIPALSFFIPMIVGAAGNAGNQTTAVIIRALGLNEITTKDYFQVMGKEFFSSILVGLTAGVINFLWVFLLGTIGVIEIDAPLYIGLITGLSLFLSIIISKFLGSGLPLLCKAIKIDPAVLAGPMLTTLVDASSVIIYLLIATKIFGGILGI